MRKETEKNNVIYERGEPGNAGVRHYQLQRNTSLLCPLKFHICQSDTKATGKHQIHHCSTVLLLALGQRHSGWLLGCVPRPPPSPKYIWFCGLQRSECRFCFFITDKSEDFIHFGFLDFLWDRCIGQGLCHICHPQGDGLR